MAGVNSAPLTSVLLEWPEINSNVMLLAAQGTVAAFQIISVAGVLSDPLNLVAAIGFGRELGDSALSGRVRKEQN